MTCPGCSIVLIIALFPLNVVGLRINSSPESQMENSVDRLSQPIQVDNIETNKHPTFLHAATKPLQNMRMRYVAGQEQSGSAASVIQECQNLLHHEPGMKRETWSSNSLYLHDEPVEAAHVFYRFSGKSRHDHGDQHTPVLGAISFLGALERLSKAQRGSVNVYVIVGSKVSSDVRTWWTDALKDLGLETFTLLNTKEGNVNSYETMLTKARNVEDTTRAMMFFLEEDYLCHPDMMLKLFDFWSSYNPCFAVPYDYPDRYTRNDNHGYGEETILKTPFRHWRTVESTTVTFITRLDVFHILDAKSSLPHPTSDRARSWAARDLVGIWGPMPSLASHRHRDNSIQVDSDFDYEEFEKMLTKKADQTPMFQGK